MVLCMVWGTAFSYPASNAGANSGEEYTFVQGYCTKASVQVRPIRGPERAVRRCHFTNEDGQLLSASVQQELASRQQFPQASGQQWPQASGQQFPQASGQQFPQASGQQFPQASGQDTNDMISRLASMLAAQAQVAKV